MSECVCRANMHQDCLTRERAEVREEGKREAAREAAEKVRCQHQAGDASLDCDSPAVLCEHHGGHDGCAVAEMELQQKVRQLEAENAVLREQNLEMNKSSVEGYKQARDEGYAEGYKDGWGRE